MWINVKLIRGEYGRFVEAVWCRSLGPVFETTRSCVSDIPIPVARSNDRLEQTLGLEWRPVTCANSPVRVSADPPAHWKGASLAADCYPWIRTSQCLSPPSHSHRDAFAECPWLQSKGVYHCEHASSLAAQAPSDQRTPVCLGTNPVCH